MYPRYRHTATFDGFRLPFFCLLKWKVTPQLKIYVLTSTFMIMT